jgi:hypothetical protein
VSRKLIIILICSILAIAGSYLFYYIKVSNAVVSDPYVSIPASSALVLQINNSLSLFDKLTTTSIMWEELNQVPLFSSLDDNLVFLRHFAERDKDIGRLFRNQKLIISAEKTSGMDFDFLFSIAIPQRVSNKSLTDLPREIFEKIGRVNKRSYEGIEIIEVNLTDSIQDSLENRVFSYSVHNGLFVGSFNIPLLEKSIQTLLNGQSIVAQNNFNSIKSTAAEDTDANLFLSCNLFTNILELYINPEYAKDVELLKNSGNWTELDINFKPDAINLNGFIQSADTVNFKIDYFKNQNPQKIQVTPFIPNNIAYLSHLGLSNYRRFQKITFQENKQREDEIQNINAHYGINIEEDFNSWIENEIAYIITEPSTELNSDVYFALLRSKNLERSKEILRELADKSNENNDYESMLILNKYPVNKVNIPNILPLILGNQFKELHNAYYTVLDNYILWGNSVAALRKYLNQIERDNTLNLDPHYQKFEQHLSEESNIFIYSSIARSSQIYKKIIAPDYAPLIDSNLSVLRKFFGGAIQIISDNSNMYFTNMYFKYDPVYKEENAALWEVNLDTMASMKPFIHTNHYTYNKEVFIQDLNNVLYLISPTGKILWKRKIEEPILGEVRQIDALNNNKLQVLFNTKSKLFLIDRNGRDVFDYPINLRSDATSSLSVFDYDNDNNLRIMVSCEDKNIYAFDKEGKVIDGWDFSPSETAIDLPLKHIALNKRDYIIAIDRAGVLRGFSRKGKERLKLNQTINYSKNNSYYIEVGQNLSKTSIIYTDSTGNFCRTYLNEKTEYTNIQSFSSDHYFEYADFNNDKKKDIIICDQKLLAVHNQDKSSILSLDLDTISYNRPLVFDFQNERKIGLYSSENQMIYLFNEAGLQPEDFPTFGSSNFSISDINQDGTFDLIVNGNNNKVYAYRLE